MTKKEKTYRKDNKIMSCSVCPFLKENDPEQNSMFLFSCTYPKAKVLPNVRYNTGTFSFEEKQPSPPSCCPLKQHSKVTVIKTYQIVE